jgi:hypothetical protein
VNDEDLLAIGGERHSVKSRAVVKQTVDFHATKM